MSTVRPNERSTKILAIALLLIVTIITVFIPYPSNTLRYSIYILSGIGIALLFIKQNNEAKTSIKIRNITTTIVGGAVIPVLLIIYDPIGYFKESKSPKVGTTVFVHGKNGKMDMVLKRMGYVIMELNGDRIKKSIGDNGEARFDNLQVGDQIRLSIDFSEPFVPVNPDSIYTIDGNGKIYLQVALKGIDIVQGTVLHQDAPLEGVIVKTGNITTTTNNTGSFQLKIPEAEQSDHYQVWFMKPGFRTIRTTAYPQTGVPIDIVMMK
ncbi:hypothetical protein ACX0HA_08745 [Flavobacterium hauense]